MKKTLFTLVLIFTLLVSCEKQEHISEKINGTFTGEVIKLPNLDYAKFTLEVGESVIKDLFLTSIKSNYIYSLEIESIILDAKTKKDYITAIYFNFICKEGVEYFGILEFNKSDLDIHELIGYLKISDRWEYILYFK